jgi:hypothetical protein
VKLVKFFKKKQTFLQFIEAHGDDEDITLLVERAKRVNNLCGVNCNPLSIMTYRQVCDIREAYLESPVIAIKLVLNCYKFVTESKVFNASSKDVMYFWSWLHEQLIGIKTAEDNLSDPDPLMEEAGAGDLAKYGHINVVDGLAGGDMTKWDGIYAMKYEEVYTKLLKDKETEQIRERYAELNKIK